MVGKTITSLFILLTFYGCDCEKHHPLNTMQWFEKDFNATHLSMVSSNGLTDELSIVNATDNKIEYNSKEDDRCDHSGEGRIVEYLPSLSPIRTTIIISNNNIEERCLLILNSYSFTFRLNSPLNVESAKYNYSQDLRTEIKHITDTMINNVKYEDVYRLVIDSPSSIRQVLYARSTGVLGYSFTNGVSWSRK